MWILVIGRETEGERPDGAVATLRDLGCRVQANDLWDGFDEMALAADPPTAILIEALDEVDAGRAAVSRVRAVDALASVPVLLAVTVSGMSRVDSRDAFDDFVLIPYLPAELYLRVRRAEWSRSEFSATERIKIGAMEIDLAAHEVAVEGRNVELTHQEFALLSFLAQNRGRVYTRDQLLTRVWGVDYYGGSRTVDIHVRRLRMKLGPAAEPIQTVRGVGYKMKVP